MSAISPARYLAIAAAVVGALAILTAAFNIYVDPYRMYGTDRLPVKPDIYRHAALAKSYMLLRAHARTVILGNSRTQIGIDPDSREWPASAKPVFNAAEANGDLFGAYRLLQHAMAASPPQLIVVGVDFNDFRETRRQPDSVGADERRLLVNRDGSTNGEMTVQLWRDFFLTALSLDALRASVHTVLDQHDPAARTMTKDGFNPLREFGPIVARAGLRQIFLQNGAQYAARLREQTASPIAAGSGNAELEHLSDIARLAAEHKARLIVFIQPYHVRYLEMLHDQGLWPAFVAWKEAMLAAIDAAAGPERDLVRVFDFTDYDDVSTERIPDAGDTRSIMRWYLDPTHYSRDLGDLMIACMMGAGPVLGAEIDDTTIAANNARIDMNRDRLLGDGHEAMATEPLKLTARDKVAVPPAIQSSR